MQPKATSPTIVYLAHPEVSDVAVSQLAQQQQVTSPVLLARRGYAIGWIGQKQAQSRLSADSEKQDWSLSRVVFWPQMLAADLTRYTVDLDNADQLYTNVIDGASCADLLEAGPCYAELSAKFNLLSCSYDESDLQQVERLDFEPAGEPTDAVDSEIWMKASWLSYAKGDASLRFRFSFGIDGCEDVAADPWRQRLASELAQIIFPESKIITHNGRLHQELRKLFGVKEFEFVERIIYFNAPDGGAQFHQDVERGHLGVIFSQLSGRTVWLALSKQQLIHEIIAFLARDEAKLLLPKILKKKQQTLLFKHANDPIYINQWLDQRDNEALDIFINQTPAFNQQLIENGYAYLLQAGDVLLLPQKNMDNCAWHSVFCIDDSPGEALSFAIKTRDGIN